MKNAYDGHITRLDTDEEKSLSLSISQEKPTKMQSKKKKRKKPKHYSKNCRTAAKEVACHRNTRREREKGTKEVLNVVTENFSKLIPDAKQIQEAQSTPNKINVYLPHLPKKKKKTHLGL